MKLQPLNFTYCANGEFHDFSVPVKISTNYRFFFWVKDLPETLIKLEQLHGDRQYFDDINTLRDCIEKLCTEIELSFVKEAKEKVILYEIKNVAESRGATRILEIKFNWAVVQKVETRKFTKKGEQSDTTYYSERGYGGYSIGEMMDTYSTTHFDTHQEMPWTAEREAWFIEIDRAIESLGGKITKGFGSHAEVLMSRIAKGMKLLAAKEEE